MYRSCIFCSAPLGANESIERFPVGRNLAYDGEKGRLWAVCPRCARWNLAPIGERWEAIEEAERLFRDTRLRVQRGNIGLAKLRDGMRLVRVGEALAGELAAWRYGETLVQRRRRMLIHSAPLVVAGVGVSLAGVFAGGAAAWAWYATQHAAMIAQEQIRARKVIARTRTPDGVPVRVLRGDLRLARLGTAGDELELHLPPPAPGAEGPGAHPLVLRGGEMRMALSRAMVDVNAGGASRSMVDHALSAIQSAGSPREFLHSAARQRLLLNGTTTPDPTLWQALKERVVSLVDVLDVSVLNKPITWPRRGEGDSAPAIPPPTSIALEMALHEETERRALDGELAMLEGMWREAEAIAAIADRLPELPASEPPRLSAES
ncbi:MAG TPA: hypothetical protein VFT45_26330 [Longimicrobium sp.]|nr:hypothetical protein [Longimicrobium sp.]